MDRRGMGRGRMVREGAEEAGQMEAWAGDSGEGLGMVVGQEME